MIFYKKSSKHNSSYSRVSFLNLSSRFFSSFKMPKDYKDIQSTDKDYINMMVRETIRENPEGKIVYLDGPDCRSTECYVKSLNPKNLTIIENNPEVFQIQRNSLHHHEGINHIQANVFDYLKSANPTHLYLDLMTDYLKDEELRIIKEWLVKVIGEERDPNLFLTLTGRSRGKGRLSKRSEKLTRELDSLKLGIGLKTEYAYCRTGKTAMVFLHFCLYEGETECRPHRIVGERPDGSFLVKWWGDSKEGTLEDPNSPALRMLEAEDIKHTCEAEMLSRCMLDLPGIARDGVTLHPVGFFEGYLYNIKFLNLVEELCHFYIESISPTRKDNFSAFALGGLIYFLEEHDQRHVFIFQEFFTKIQNENNVSQKEAESHFSYAKEMWKLCKDYPLFTMTKLSLDGFCDALKTFISDSENEHLPRFLHKTFWEKSPGDHLRWSGRRKDLFLDLQDHARIIINDPKTNRWI